MSIRLSRLKNKIARAAARAIDFPQSAFGCSSSFSCDGDSMMMIEGCKSILNYRQDCILLQLCDRRLKIGGEELILKTYYKSSISVCGRIRSIELISQGKAEDTENADF